MKRVEILCCALLLALCSSINVEGQAESSLASRVTEVLKTKEPGWKWVAAIESGRVPLVPSEKRVLVAIWESPQVSGISESVHLSIYEVENPGQAMEWLRPVRSKQVAAGWQISIYRIGDEGYLARYQDGKRFEIQFRSGSIVGKIAGDNLSRVREFAKYIVDQISAQ